MEILSSLGNIASANPLELGLMIIVGIFSLIFGAKIKRAKNAKTEREKLAEREQSFTDNRQENRENEEEAVNGENAINDLINNRGDNEN